MGTLLILQRKGTRAEPESSTTSILSEGTSDHHDWEAERTTGYTLKFYRKPVVRQYFHKGLLWRAPESEEVASFEVRISNSIWKSKQDRTRP